MSKEKKDPYEEVTNKIIAALESGVNPWTKPWGASPIAPRNFISKKPYQGINVLLTGMQGYASPYWMSYKQAQAKGGQVRGGEKGTQIVYWKLFKVNVRVTRGALTTTEEQNRPFLRLSTVFNAEQIDGIDFPEIKLGEFDPNEDGEKLVSNWSENESPISYGGNRAYYSPLSDSIGLPTREQFDTPASFYSTAFHEMVHSTGHESRLNREFGGGFGSEPYGKEELVAEMGAAFVAATIGLEQITPSAEYLAGWLKKIRGDKKLVVTAAGKATKAAQLILGENQSAEEVEA